MSGRITSTVPGVNPHGVKFEEILNLHKQAAARLDAAKTEALKSWLELDEARGSKRPAHVVRRLRNKALKATELALS
jgi:hypothetical protein